MAKCICGKQFKTYNGLRSHTYTCQITNNSTNEKTIRDTPSLNDIWKIVRNLVQENSKLKEEVFGPVLHIVRYSHKNISKVVDAIHATGYGLTVGIHSRMPKFAENLAKQLDVGNVYINRNMIGAVVGVQPFGGNNLSGTGPKAGGPWYLTRLSKEQVISTNTAAIGGNPSLLALDN